MWAIILQAVWATALKLQPEFVYEGKIQNVPEYLIQECTCTCAMFYLAWSKNKNASLISYNVVKSAKIYH